jgi:nucleotide sugar dehydrogenase
VKIGLFGLGYVGTAVAHTHRNQELIIRDPKLGDKSAGIEEIKDCDAIYVCVPTPMSDDGHCDDSYVRSVLKELEDYKNVIICKSTVPPGVYLRLLDRYPNLVHAPEFLTAANATNDYETSTWVLIGGNNEFANKAKSIISSSTIEAKHYHLTDIATASLFKYMANSFMATKVTFMNDLYHLAKSVGVDWEEIKELAKNDHRLGSSHWDVPGPDGQFGYGGACFPKDVSAIIEHGLDIGTPQKLLEAVKEINQLHRSSR